MLRLFGLTLAPAGQPLGREAAATLAARMQAAALTLQGGAPGPVAAGVRLDAQRYLTARRLGELRFAGGAARPCDEGAWTLMQLTVDAPPARPVPAQLVA